MKKVLKIFTIAAGTVAGLFILLIAVSAVLYSPEYMYRILVNGKSKITDYKLFPQRVIEKSGRPYVYCYNIDPSYNSLDISYKSKGESKTEKLDALAEQNGTTSLIIIKGDEVVYEKYFNGYGKNSVETSFSSVKSLDSLMIGIAIEDGYIRSIGDSISDYIPEFKGKPFEDITIENLLMMRSKISYVEGIAWFSDDAKTYYSPDLKNLALNHMNINPDYQGQFHYNNYHPLLLGIILERATGMHVADYFQKKIWEKIGAEYDASWSLDSEAAGFEKMESGLNFYSIDYAKIGSMLLHGGNWNGNILVSEDWLQRSTIAPAPLEQSDIDSEFLKGISIGYQYMWYCTENDKGGHDFFAAGKYGQFIYISPENDTVIVRTGMSEGRVDWWPDVFKQIAEYEA